MNHKREHCLLKKIKINFGFLTSVVLPTCAMIHCPPCPFHIAGLRWIPSSGGRVADIEPSTRTKAAGFRVGQGSPKIYWSRFRVCVYIYICM